MKIKDKYHLGLILWNNDSFHENHLHIEGDKAYSGTGTPRCAGGSTGPAVDDPDLVKLWTEVDKLFPNTRYGGIFVCKRKDSNPNNPWSEHAYHNALDVMIDHPVGNNDTALGNKIFAWLNSDVEEEASFLDKLTNKEQHDVLDSTNHTENFAKGMGKAWKINMDEKGAFDEVGQKLVETLEALLAK